MVVSGLAIHTSSPELGLATNYKSQVWYLERSLSNQFHSLLKDFIYPQSWSDFDFISVAIGPGSFTGTRVGVVAARTLAQQLNIPLFGVSSLAAIAYQQKIDKAIAVSIPGSRGMLFTGIYQGLTPLLGDQVLTKTAWTEILDNWSSPYELIEIPSGMGLGSSVEAVLEIGYQAKISGCASEWNQVVPFYGQSPV